MTSMLRAAGIDFKIISAIMGHSTITITQDRYTHLSPADLAIAGAQLETFLGETTGAVTATA